MFNENESTNSRFVGFQPTEFMYKRMKNWIRQNYTNKGYSYIVMDKLLNNITITDDNIDKEELKDVLINGRHGYRDYFLWQHYKSKNALDTINFTHRWNMIEDLSKYSKEQPIHYLHRTMDELYELWLMMDAPTLSSVR